MKFEPDCGSNVVDVRLAVGLRRGLLSNMIGGIILLIGPILHDIADRLDSEHQKLIEIEINDMENGSEKSLKCQDSRLVSSFCCCIGSYGIEKLNLNLDGVSAYLDLIPYGVIGAITAWNSPLMIAAEDAPALAGGNAVVIKQIYSASTIVFAELSDIVPDGLINVVAGYGDEVGTAIVESDGASRLQGRRSVDQKLP